MCYRSSCCTYASTWKKTGPVPSRSGSRPLDVTAAAKIAVVLERIEQGKLSNVKGVGAGVLEYRLDFGPGYRVYFGRDGDVLVILLAGGTKKRQQHDIEAAQARWAAYKRRKRMAR